MAFFSALVVDVPLDLPVGIVDRRLEADQRPDKFLTGLHEGRDVDLIGLADRDAVERLDVLLDLCQPTRQAVLELECLGEYNLLQRHHDLSHRCLLPVETPSLCNNLMDRAGAGEVRSGRAR